MEYNRQFNKLRFEKFAGVLAIMWAVRNIIVSEEKATALPSNLWGEGWRKPYTYEEQLQKHIKFGNPNPPSILHGLSEAIKRSLYLGINNINTSNSEHIWIKTGYGWILEDPFFNNVILELDDECNIQSLAQDNESKSAWGLLHHAAASGAEVTLSLIILEKMMTKDAKLDAGIAAMLLSKISLLNVEDVTGMINFAELDNTEQNRSNADQLNLGALFRYNAEDNTVFIPTSNLKSFGYGVAAGCPASMNTPKEYIEWFEKRKEQGFFPPNAKIPTNFLKEFVNNIKPFVWEQLEEFERISIESGSIHPLDKILFPEKSDIILGPIPSMREGESGISLKCPFH